jgi:hypothetical protein
MSDHPQSAAIPEPSWSPVVELRQYTLRPGERDVLIDLFEREFIEPQEVLGMRVLGHFRDLDDPDRFVWLRGFHDLPARAEGLAAFYGGPVWKAHREVANATMLDSDNVLLLRPARSASGFSPITSARPSRGSNAAREGQVIATVYSLDEGDVSAFIEYVEGELTPALNHLGGALLAYLVTEKRPNTFPGLPVREGENVFIWFAGFPKGAIPDEAAPGHGRLGRSIPAAPQQSQPIQVLRLEPAARSMLTGGSQACAPIAAAGLRT